MKKNNLIVLKTTHPLFWEGEGFALNTVYRCLTPIETESDSYLINGFWFTQAEFDLYFEFAYDRVIRDWKSLGLVKEDVTGSLKAITFKEFKERMNIHFYGKQINNLRIGYVGIPKENFYKFYPMVNANKQIQLKEMYSRYQYVLEGNMYYLDGRWIQFGTFGVHIPYVRK